MQYDVELCGLVRIFEKYEDSVSKQTKEEPTNLVYDENTKVIYYSTSPYNYQYAHMANYVSENGKFCKYIDGKIVEID